MNLHDIAPGDMTALIWGHGYGGTGHTFGDGMDHLFPWERGTPPPIGDRNRRGWLPWNTRWDHAPDGTKPACGTVIRTRAQYRMFAVAWRNGLNRKCPACERMGGEFQPELQRNDAYWQALNALQLDGLGWAERQNAIANLIDPVTGL